MFPTEDRRFERLDALFGLFVRGKYDEFLAGCADNLVLNVHGSARLATLVPKAQISQWLHSTQQLAGGTFRSSICFILVTEHAGIVVLTHMIDRNGVRFRYETVNHCTLRDDLLAGWFSRPMDVSDYAEAWGLPRAADPQLASRAR
jgi:ketosteroid isomerase-like protein